MRVLTVRKKNIVFIYVFYPHFIYGRVASNITIHRSMQQCQSNIIWLFLLSILPNIKDMALGCMCVCAFVRVEFCILFICRPNKYWNKHLHSIIIDENESNSGNIIMMMMLMVCFTFWSSVNVQILQIQSHKRIFLFFFSFSLFCHWKWKKHSNGSALTENRNIWIRYFDVCRIHSFVFHVMLP